MKSLRNRKGFTLIELVVVIVILGILMMLVIPRVSEYQKGAQQTTCKGNQRILSSSQAAYYATEKAYALSCDALVTAKLIPTDIKCPTAGATGNHNNYSISNATEDYFKWACTYWKIGTNPADSKYDHNKN